MQMHSSYVVTDPKGTILVECGKMLQRGAPKLGKDGKPMKDKHGKVIYEPYRIKVLNTINFKKSMDKDYCLHLTAIGRDVAEKIYERHQFFAEQLIAAGVDQETAEQDACRIEHAISDTSFRKLKEKVQGTD